MLRLDSWLDLVGKSLVLISAGIQFFWLTPIQDAEQASQSLMVRNELMVLSGEISSLNRRIDSLRLQEALDVNATDLMAEMIESVDGMVESINSPEFRGAISGMSESVTDETTKRSRIFFLTFLLGSIFIIAGDYLRAKREIRSGG